MKRHNDPIIVYSIAAITCLGIAGCGIEKPVDTAAASGDVQTTRHFLTWDPGDDLVGRHTCWHVPTACEQVCNQETGWITRACDNRGEDFFFFHRQFLNELRNRWEANPMNVGDTTPWTRVPDELRKEEYGWDPATSDAEWYVENMIDPDTGLRFADINTYGTYVENFYHGVLHAVAAAKYADTDSSIGPYWTSPTSTFFFKIHGYVDYLAQRFQHGDFNKDGNSDILEHDDDTGDVNIWPLFGTIPMDPIHVDTVNGCGYYVGAIADLDYDGNLDLIWHGPDCNSVVFWKMLGAEHIGPDIVLPNVDNNWRLIGAADYNSDARPDLLWRYTWTNSSTVVVWQMNGTNSVGGTVIDNPFPGYRALAPIDANNDLVPDILIESNGSLPRHWKVATTDGHLHITGSSFELLGDLPNSGYYTSLVGVGRFNADWGSQTHDLLFRSSPPQLYGTYSFRFFQWSDTSAAYYWDPGQSGTVLSTQSIWGPR